MSGNRTMNLFDSRVLPLQFMYRVVRLISFSVNCNDFLFHEQRGSKLFPASLTQNTIFFIILTMRGEKMRILEPISLEFEEHMYYTLYGVDLMKDRFSLVVNCSTYCSS